MISDQNDDGLVNQTNQTETESKEKKQAIFILFYKHIEKMMQKQDQIKKTTQDKHRTG